MTPPTIIGKRTELNFFDREEADSLSAERVFEVWERVRGNELASLRYERNELTGEVSLKLYPFALVSQQTMALRGQKEDGEQPAKSWGLKLSMLGAPVCPDEYGEEDEMSYFIKNYWMPIKRAVSKQVTLCYMKKRDLETGARQTDFDLLVDFRCEHTDKVLAEASDQLAETIRELIVTANAAESPAAKMLDRLSMDLLFALIHEEE